MRNRVSLYLLIMLLAGLVLGACGANSTPSAAGGAARPEWYGIQMTDVRDGKTFSMNDFAGKVVLIETIAQWCPNCLFQQGETRKMQQQLGAPDDLILISLDVDIHEDAASLRKYVADFGFQWRFSVAPTEVVRAGQPVQRRVPEPAARSYAADRPPGRGAPATLWREKGRRAGGHCAALPGERITMERSFFTPLLLGLLASTSPCILPLYPGFLAYLSGQGETTASRQRYFLGVFVLAGVLSMMLALGVLIAVLAVSIGSALGYVIPLADALIFALGVLLLLDRNPFKAIPQLRVPLLRHPFLNAYVYGLLYGPLTLPCYGPLVVSIFALSLTVGEALSSLLVFLWFGVGFGLPLLALSLLSGALQRQLTSIFARNSRLLNTLGGALLLLIAVYDLAQNWAFLRLFYS